MSIEVVNAPTVYELQQRVKESAPATVREMAKGLGDAEGWHHTKNFTDANSAYYWKERWELLWGEVFEFRFSPKHAIPERPAEVVEAPFDMQEAMQEAIEVNEAELTGAKA